ncbi:MAG: outer membrane lipoprotein-sorting protein, partial [Candidatus Omnitrophica bacterium]|nr:outer membrane lipoprotein-sorting protein [Candidatus Omnitrophota bacterium]
MKKIYFLLLLLSTFWGYSFADEDVNEIINKANLTAYYGGYDGRAVVTMTITDSQQRERKRVFKILRLDVLDGSEQKYYVYFLEPSDVRDMVYMVWKQMNKEDDRWMYLSAL